MIPNPSSDDFQLHRFPNDRGLALSYEQVFEQRGTDCGLHLGRDRIPGVWLRAPGHHFERLKSSTVASLSRLR